MKEAAVLFTLAFCLVFAPCDINAHSGVIDKTDGIIDVQGIWQLSIPADQSDGTTVNFVPMWKIYLPDGHYTVMVWQSDKQSAYITTSGSYTTESDSVVIETISFSSPDTTQVGVRNRITATFIGNDCMLAHHMVEGTDRRWEELWKRVTPNAKSAQLPVFKESIELEKATTDADGIYTVTEEMPRFMNGDERTLLKHVHASITYPAEALAKGLEGITMVRFVVNEKGATENFKVIHSSYKILDDEAVRVLKTLHFIPGRHKGKAVKVYFTIPVSFKLK